MTLSSAEIARCAAQTGFRSESVEKVLRLLQLLRALQGHSFLRGRLALKGGTALNLFQSDVPRLSVDIDLNYIGQSDRDSMLADRPPMEQALQAVFSREGLAVKRVPSDHAGGKWRLSYTNAAGVSDKLEVDLNFMLRTPLWPVVAMDSCMIGVPAARAIPLLDPHELAAGKLAALCARTTSRDLFDARQILSRSDLDTDKLRLAFVVYGGINRKDWRTVGLDDIDADPVELRGSLVPMLREDLAPTRSGIVDWARMLVADVRDLMTAVLPLADHERGFIERLNDYGEIVPDLLTTEPSLKAVIREHPALHWKAQNVRRHRRP